MENQHEVIVMAKITNQAADRQQAMAVLEATIAIVGVVPHEMSADAGYCSPRAVAALSALGTDP